MKKRKSREERPTRNRRQTIALLLILTIVLTVVLSGCLGSEKPSDAEKQYWEHIDESKRLIGETNTMEAMREDNYTKAILMLEKINSLNLEGRNHVSKAIGLADTPQKKEYAEKLAKSVDLFILSHNKLIEAAGSLEKNDTKNGEIAAYEGLDYAKEAKKILDEAKKIEPKRF